MAMILMIFEFGQVLRKIAAEGDCYGDVGASHSEASTSQSTCTTATPTPIGLGASQRQCRKTCWEFSLTKDRPILLSVKAPHMDKKNCQTVTNIWSWASDGAWHQGGLTESRNVTLTLTDASQLQLPAATLTLWQFIWSENSDNESTSSNTISGHKDDQPARSSLATNARKTSWLLITQTLTSQPAVARVSLAFTRPTLYLPILPDPTTHSDDWPSQIQRHGAEPFLRSR
jgi:hypothetical protein